MSRKAVVVPLPKGTFRVVKPSKVYWYHQDRRGKSDAGPITALGEYGTPEFWKAVAKISGDEQLPDDTISSLIDAYEAQLLARKNPPSANTMKTYRSAWRRIKEAWGKLHPAEVSVAGVLKLQNAFSDRPSMGNMIRVQVMALMKLAVQTGLRSDNPAREIDRLEEDPDSAQPLPADAWQALLSDKAPEDLRRFAFLGRATGQRISDLIRMTPAGREQEGLNCQIMKLGDTWHWCILSQSEIAVIDGWNQFRGASYVMRVDGKRHTTNSMRDVWNDYAATEDGAALKGFTPHDLRATKVCDERISGKTHQRIAAIVCMSVEMVMKYSKRIDKKAAARGTGTERE
jgi:integrase